MGADEQRSGKLETIESDLKRPASEIFASYICKPGERMLRKADPEHWKKRLLQMKVNGKAAFLWSKLARPNIRLMPSAAMETDTTPPRTSKFGGLPDLPKGAMWPTWTYIKSPPPMRAPSVGFIGKLLGRKPGPPPPPPRPSEPQIRPLSFLAQINLADVAKFGLDVPLPEAGLLLFFYDMEMLDCGLTDAETTGARVIFVPDGTETERLASSPIALLKTRSFAFEPGEVLPHLEYVAECIPAYSQGDFEDALEVVDETVFAGGHVFGGWPNPIQTMMELECELYANGLDANPQGYKDAEERGLNKKAPNWRLLLRLESNGIPEWDWGDWAEICFFCRKEDIAAQRFDRCCVIEQMS